MPRIHLAGSLSESEEPIRKEGDISNDIRLHGNVSLRHRHYSSHCLLRRTSDDERASAKLERQGNLNTHFETSLMFHREKS